MLYRQSYLACLFAFAFGLTPACSVHDDIPRTMQSNRPAQAEQPPQADAATEPPRQAVDAAVQNMAPRPPDASVVGMRAASDDDAGTLPSAGAGGSSGAAGATPDSPECLSDLDATQPAKRLSLTGAVQLSDPALIESDGTFYAFGTGQGIVVRTSRDLLSWQDAGRVFVFNPSWIELRLDAEPELWSPDISFFGGVFHLYYAVSTQGSNRSCIGHATATSLPGPFEDQGSVLCSNLGGEQVDWNAIHPNVVQDMDGTPYLAFGSFWSGLKLVALDPTTGKLVDQKLTDIAARKQQGSAIEAPFIVRRCGYFYLFASFDRCCDGVNSTYKIYVGRSERLTGPYVDRAGTPMLQGGGTQLVIGDETWHGPGHSAIVKSAERWYEAHHAYYAGEVSAFVPPGQANLRISELDWDAAGWPVSAGP